MQLCLCSIFYYLHRFCSSLLIARDAISKIPGYRRWLSFTFTIGLLKRDKNYFDTLSWGTWKNTIFIQNFYVCKYSALVSVAHTLPWNMKSTLWALVPSDVGLWCFRLSSSQLRKYIFPCGGFTDEYCPFGHFISKVLTAREVSLEKTRSQKVKQGLKMNMGVEITKQWPFNAIYTFYYTKSE